MGSGRVTRPTKHQHVSRASADDMPKVTRRWNAVLPTVTLASAACEEGMAVRHPVTP